LSESGQHQLLLRSDALQQLRAVMAGDVDHHFQDQHIAAVE